TCRCSPLPHHRSVIIGPVWVKPENDPARPGRLAVDRRSRKQCHAPNAADRAQQSGTGGVRLPAGTGFGDRLLDRRRHERAQTLAGAVPSLDCLIVAGPQERQRLTAHSAPRTIAWRYEMSPPPESSGLVSAVAAADLPDGRGHAYLAGEVALASALKAALLNRGWGPEQISAKAYWNRGRANAGHGEPELKAS